MSSNVSVKIDKIRMLTEANIGSEIDRLRLICIWVLSNASSVEEINEIKVYAKKHFEKSKAVALESIDMLFSILDTIRMSSKNVVGATKSMSQLPEDSGVSKAAAWATNFLQEGSKLLEKFRPNLNESNVMTKVCVKIIETQLRGQFDNDPVGEVLNFSLRSN